MAYLDIPFENLVHLSCNYFCITLFSPQVENPPQRKSYMAERFYVKKEIVEDQSRALYYLVIHNLENRKQNMFNLWLTMF